VQELTVKTSSKRQILNITKDIERLLGSEVNGDVSIFIKHSTAAITTADLDPGTDQDMLDAFFEMIPNLNYRHPHDPKHVPAHILASLIGPSLTVPAKSGKLQLGTWQEVVLCEFDGPRERELVVYTY
jgi:secondary thiamine-phosphate synthase enzyme